MCSSDLALGARLASEVGVPAWNATIALGTSVTRLATIWAVGAYHMFGTTVIAASAGLMFVPVLSAWGLYLVTKQPRRERVRAYASR